MRELDAFPKVPESLVETSTSGATISIISFILISTLVVLEFRYYSQSKLRFKYDVDTDYDRKIKVNIDMTVAMPCDTIGADILDVTNQNTHTFGHLEEEPTWFELTPRQRQHWDSLKQVNTYIRHEFHSLQDLLWKSGFQSLFGELPVRDKAADYDYDACRLKGTLEVNKVSGNFHITAGKSIPHPKGHAHLAAFLRDEDYNFSHRIERFSFGDYASGIVDPLDGDEKIASSHFHIFQYFLQVVPTHVETFASNVSTYQYSVTEQEREINHFQGSHGVPGIFIKYDMSSIKVHVKEEHEPWSQFLIRLCGIIGGIFATSGIINLIISSLIDLVCCRLSATNHPVEVVPPAGSFQDDKLLQTNGNALLYPIPVQPSPSKVTTTPTTPTKADVEEET